MWKSKWSRKLLEILQKTRLQVITYFSGVIKFLLNIKLCSASFNIE